MLFLRTTKDPEGDLLRGWSGHACCWYASEAAALSHQSRHQTRPPRQDPVSGAWNADPETGLSGYGFDDETSFARALNAIEGYLGEADEHIAVFSSDTYDREAGAEGEDCFRDARCLGRIAPDATWDDVLVLLGAAPSP